MDNGVKRDASIFLGVLLLLALVSGELCKVLGFMAIGLFLLCLLPRKRKSEKRREVSPPKPEGNSTGQQSYGIDGNYRPTVYARGRPFDKEKPVSVRNVPDYLRAVQVSVHNRHCKDKSHKEFVAWFAKRIGVSSCDRDLFFKKALWEYRRKSGTWMYACGVRLTEMELLAPATKRFKRWIRCH